MRYARIGNRKDPGEIKSLIERIMESDEPMVVIIGNNNYNKCFHPEPKLHDLDWISHTPMGLGMIQEFDSLMYDLARQTVIETKTKFGTTYISPTYYHDEPTKVIEPEGFGKPKYIKKPKGRNRHPNLASQKKAKIRKKRR